MVYFAAIKRVIKNHKNLNPDKIAKEVLNGNGIPEQIIEMNKNQMYNDGVNADGNSLGQYSPATIYGTLTFKGKIAKGQPYEHVTLYDTGTFYSSFKTKSVAGGLLLTANTLKGGGNINITSPIGEQSTVDIEGEDLEMRYGKLVGLIPENKNRLIKLILPNVRELTLSQILK